MNRQAWEEGGPGRETAFALAEDARGTPFIAVLRTGRFGNIVKAGYWDGERWVLTALNASTGGYAERPQLALESDGSMVVFWEEPSFSGVAVTRKSRFNGSEWVPMLGRVGTAWGTEQAA